MNVNIEKIDNGYVVTVGSKKTFCSTGESICGLLAEWAQDEVERLEKPSASEQLSAAMAQLQAQAPKIGPLGIGDDMELLVKK